MKHSHSAFSNPLTLALSVLVLTLGSGCEAKQRAEPQALPEPEALAQAPQGSQAGKGSPRVPPIQALQPAEEQPAEEQPAIGGSGRPESLADLVEAVQATVVNVDVQARTQAPAMPEGFDFFERFFGAPPGAPGAPPGAPPGAQPEWPGGMPGERIQQGQGSGFIIDPSGLILTNNHVVESAIDIRVTLEDGREFDAKVLGRDPLTDLALLKLQGNVKDLPVARLGDSDAVRVGDWVVAIGSPFGLTTSVSTGILSARARDIQAGPYDNFLQTDAAINPGNSGGPLFNMRGEVIGINTAIVGGGTGIGFAVPSNMARRLLPQLQQGEIRRGWLGVAVQDLTPELAQALEVPVRKGAIVTDVQPDTPAAKAGLKTDDVIVSLNGEPIETSRGLTRNVGFRAPGETVKLTVYREGKKRELQVKLGERPDLEGLGTAPQGQDEEPGLKLGLRLQDVDPRMAPGVKQGAMITGVEPASPADRAGLAPGMVIVEAGGKPVTNPREFAQIVRGAKSGTSLLLRIQIGENRLLRALTIP